MVKLKVTKTQVDLGGPKSEEKRKKREKRTDVKPT